MTEQDRWEPTRPDPNARPSPEVPPENPDVMDLIPIEERGKLPIVVALMVALFVPIAAVAQQHPDLVASVKSDLQARHVDLSGPCGAFAITKRVAWQLRSEGAGLLSKPAGNNCDGFSVDYVVYLTGRGVDILGDAGGNNSPGWSEDVDPDFVARWRAPTDPGDSAPLPPPPPSGGGVESTDFLQRLMRLENNGLITNAALIEIKALATQSLTEIKEHRAAVSREYYKWAAILGPIVTGIVTYFRMRVTPVNGGP